MNNAVNNPKTLSRLWAALYCDFESLLARFMGCPGWRYIHFAKICREMEITLIMHITQGRGKTKDEHYSRITDMILQMAKELWLRTNEAKPKKPPSSTSSPPPPEVEEEERKMTTEDHSMEMKRQLGGFYLLYTMFEKQPIKDKVKIGMGYEDLYTLHQFCRDIEKLPFYEEVAFMLKYLEEKNSYYYCVRAEDYRFDASTRNFLNISKSDVVGLTRKMRDSQDVLAYSSVHERCDRAFKDLTIVKQSVAKDILKCSSPKDLGKHLVEDSAYFGFMRAVNGDAMRAAMRNLDKILDKPVMTLHGLTATEAIDRRIMMETRRRMERARKKAMQTHERDGEGHSHKAVRPYVREGGIFGRKKETEEGEDKAKRRERGACNGNLWIFINGQDFYKPMSGAGEDGGREGEDGEGSAPHGGDKRKEKGKGGGRRKGKVGVEAPEEVVVMKGEEYGGMEEEDFEEDAMEEDLYEDEDMEEVEG